MTAPGALVESSGENMSEPPDWTAERMPFCCIMSWIISASAGDPTLCNGTKRASLVSCELSGDRRSTSSAL
jgi:hypothetical protein